MPLPNTFGPRSEVLRVSNVYSFHSVIYVRFPAYTQWAYQLLLNYQRVSYYSGLPRSRFSN